MALPLPSVDDFETFWGDEADDIDEERAELLIQLAANLFWLATKLDTQPSDPRLAQLVKYAIIDMAIYVYITRDDIEAEYSPFQSERIGSYNYSKHYNKLVKSTVTNEPTGVPLFDKVVAEILDELAYGGGTVVGGQHVFREYYVPLRYAANGAYRDINRDPDMFGDYGSFSSADIDTGLYDH